MPENHVIPQIPLFVGGARRAAHSTRTTPVFNPATGTVAAHVPLGDATDIEAVIADAAAAAHAWGERSAALGKVDFIADYNGDLAEAMGLAVTIPGLGKRFARFAIILEDGIVQDVFIQDVAGVTVSGAPAIILALEGQGTSVSA